MPLCRNEPHALPEDIHSVRTSSTLPSCQSMPMFSSIMRNTLKSCFTRFSDRDLLNTCKTQTSWQTRSGVRAPEPLYKRVSRNTFLELCCPVQYHTGCSVSTIYLKLQSPHADPALVAMQSGELSLSQRCWKLFSEQPPPKLS